VDIPTDGAEGVLLSQGANNSGFTFYVQGGRLHYAHNYVGRATYRVASTEDVPAGRHQLRFEFEPTDKPDIARGQGSPGIAQLYIDGHLAGEAEFPVTTPVIFNPGALACGANPGSAVVPDYEPPFRFTGTLYTVIVDLSGDLIIDGESEMRLALGRQ
jgi:arylsulfatase